jgi:hypothetical protein
MNGRTGPNLDFEASVREIPQAVRFRIAASTTGLIRYCFLETSSGDAALDEQARRYIMLLQPPETNPLPQSTTDQELIWGTATILWGNDVGTEHLKKLETKVP